MVDYGSRDYRAIASVTMLGGKDKEGYLLPIVSVTVTVGQILGASTTSLVT